MSYPSPAFGGALFFRYFPLLSSKTTGLRLCHTKKGSFWGEGTCDPYSPVESSLTIITRNQRSKGILKSIECLYSVGKLRSGGQYGERWERGASGDGGARDYYNPGSRRVTCDTIVMEIEIGVTMAIIYEVQKLAAGKIGSQGI